MRRINTSTPTCLKGPVEVSLLSKEQCEDSPLLRDFRCPDGPAAKEVSIIVENLISGEALPQSVALLSERGSNEVLGIASVRLDGNAQLRRRPSAPWFVRRLASNPYVNVIARDGSRRNTLLSDGQTRLGSVLVRAALETIEVELDVSQLPTVWALIQRKNQVSKSAFAGYAFYPHARSQENPQDVYVRRAGRPLPAAPPLEAYVPLAGSEAPAAEHLSA